MVVDYHFRLNADLFRVEQYGFCPKYFGHESFLKLFEAAFVLAVEVVTDKRATVIADNDTVWVKRRRKFGFFSHFFKG